MKRADPLAVTPQTPPILPASPDVVIEALSPLLTEQRIARIDAILARRTRSVIPVLDGVLDPHNVAAILRSADAFGVQEVHVIQQDEPLLTSQRVTQGCERWLDLAQHPSVERCIATLRARDFRVYVATMDGTLGPEELAGIPRAAIVFGNEHSGVSLAAAALSDGQYRIPMRGFSQSLNVSVAAAITLYHATAGRPGDLEERDRQRLRARFMMLSVPRADEVVARRLDARTHE